MTITQRQFNYLNEMGIKVWRQRNTENTPEVITSSNNHVNSTHKSNTPITPILIDSNRLFQHTLFTDILQSIDISIGEVVIDNNQINLGLFNWQFIETDTISFSKNILTTPVIATFEEKPELKKDLWKVIQQEVLV
jgi:DNA polymerase III psi subunit